MLMFSIVDGRTFSLSLRSLDNLNSSTFHVSLFGSETPLELKNLFA